jgi:hypothetical protein
MYINQKSGVDLLNHKFTDLVDFSTLLLHYFG